MIWLIAKKDFLLNLLSVRFIIGFMLCLFVIPFTLVVSVDGYLNQMRIYKVDKEAADNHWKEVREYSYLRPIVVKEPSALSIFSRGISDNIGTYKEIEFGEVPLFLQGKMATRDNPFLNAFFSIDFVTVIAMLISLLALVFSYDAVTREKEDGTMKLVFTGQVSRISFLFGKLLGLMLTLLPILLFCYLLACLIVVINPEVAFSPADWSGIGLLFLTSIIYMLVFILLGMLISTLSRSSSTSIVISLLCWIWLLFLVPGISPYLAQSIVKVNLYENVQLALKEIDTQFQKQVEEKEMEIRRNLNLKNLSYFTFNSGPDGRLQIYGGWRSIVEFHKQVNAIMEPVRIDNADKKWIIQKDYLDKLQHQQRVQQYISWLSPFELFRQSMWKLCHTDADSYLRYMQTIRNYRETLISYFKTNKLFESIKYFTAQPLETFYTDEQMETINHLNFYNEDAWFSDHYGMLDLNDVPRYTSDVSLSSALNDAIGYLAGMLALIIVLSLVAIASFMKYDIR